MSITRCDPVVLDEALAGLEGRAVDADVHAREERSRLLASR